MFMSQWFISNRQEDARDNENNMLIWVAKEHLDEREEHDMNGDGVADIQVRSWCNGDVKNLAISEYGYEVLGDNMSEDIREGQDMNSLIDLFKEREETREAALTGIEEIIKWVAIGAVVIGATYVSVKIIPPLIDKR
jgi:hypothetical protein